MLECSEVSAKMLTKNLYKFINKNNYINSSANYQKTNEYF